MHLIVGILSNRSQHAAPPATMGMHDTAAFSSEGNTVLQCDPQWLGGCLMQHFCKYCILSHCSVSCLHIGAQICECTLSRERLVQLPYPTSAVIPGLVKMNMVRFVYWHESCQWRLVLREKWLHAATQPDSVAHGLHLSKMVRRTG